MRSEALEAFGCVIAKNFNLFNRSVYRKQSPVTFFSGARLFAYTRFSEKGNEFEAQLPNIPWR